MISICILSRKYRNLLTSNSVFWAEGGAKVQLNGSGLTVQASPLSRALKGAISFDNLSGASASQRKGDKRILYASETAARAVGGQITASRFRCRKTGGRDANSAISVLNRANPDAGSDYPRAMKYRQRRCSIRNMSRPLLAVVRASQLSHRKFRQLALSILILSSQPYINVEPGRGNPRRDFELQEATITDSRYPGCLSIIVEAPEAGSLGIGTPVLFRGLEVGTVTGMTLGTLSDRVMIAMRISKRYQHLVRNNSVFWLASGYSLDFGLTGGVVKTGTFNQFIRGGIAFATPPGTPLATESPGRQALPVAGK
ncbi:mce-like protein [Escherichia coli]|uniref:Mce-like protein n=1 Tax=Escherichia coli TaxID=562 RepID=A0A376VGF9_ECOLX|nr:mce-like protein [Escherichia coli]